jgi:hypothetical protein
MREVMDEAVLAHFGLRYTDWDDEERSVANLFLAETTHIPSEAKAAATATNALLRWLAEKYDLVDIRDTGWPGSSLDDNS